MEHAKSQDWIPSGWIEQFKVTGGRQVKYYYNIETGQKFFSKKDLLQYVQSANLCHGSPQQTSDLDETSSEPMPEHSKKRSVRSKKTKSSETGDSEMRSEPMPEYNEIMAEPMSDQEERSSEPIPPATRAAETPEWLPQGWIMEVKAQGNGSRKIKCYIDQVTGQKFYSKPQVFEYLKVAKLDSSTSTPKQKKMGNVSVSNASSQNQVLILNSADIQILSVASVGELAGGKTSLNLEGSDNMKSLEGTTPSSKRKQRGFGLKLGEKVAIERFTPDGLPPGWIKEIKIERKSTGIRKDPYYTDPLSGFVFRSGRDALRYLETGDIATCAIKPRKREELGFLNGETSVDNNNIETGKNFFSKKDHVQYVERENLCRDSPQHTSKLDEMSSELMPEHSRRRSVRSKKTKSSETVDNELRSEPMSDHEERSSDPVPLELKAPKTPEWLPQGWIMEMNAQGNGSRKIKCYIDQVSGRKFYSKPQVFEYLKVAKLDSATSTPKQKKMASVGEFTGGETSVNLEGCDNMKSLEGTTPSSKRKRKGFGLKLGGKVTIERFTPDGLPPGWIKEIRIEVKSKGIRKDPYYTDPLSGFVFRSERDALRYLETGDIATCAIKPRKREELGFLNGETSVDLAMKADETPEWLPQGWIMDVKAQGNSSRKTKCYIDQVSGQKFYSKPQVFEYLKAVKLDSSISTSQQKKTGNDSVSNASVGESGGKTSLNLEGTTPSSKQKHRGFGSNLDEKVVIERSFPDELPAGWIKEIKIEMKSTGIRKDPYYTDPVSGFVFRSQKDAMRYLETGDISVCAIRPKKREELSFLNVDTSVYDFQEE